MVAKDGQWERMGKRGAGMCGRAEAQGSVAGDLGFYQEIANVAFFFLGESFELFFVSGPYILIDAGIYVGTQL